MPRGRPEEVHYQRVELGGVRYAVLRERVLLNLCRAAGVTPQRPGGDSADAVGTLEQAEQLDGTGLARRLAARRKELGLSQVRLAQRAGVRVETLNRIERGRVTPDFATIRKLVLALREAGG